MWRSMGTINQQAMDQLHFVTELAHRIKSTSDPACDEIENSSEFVSFFPDFVWTVRDFTLELEADGNSITSDEYLEIALKPKKGKPEEVKMFNLPRQCIRQFFPRKKCFIFDRPTHRKKLAQLEKLHDNELDPEFVGQVESFCSYIFNNSNVKTLQGGITVNGPRLENLVLTYVEAITSGDMPCMENAVLALAQIENSAAVKRALTYYEETMIKKVQFPTETLQDLLDIHATCEKEAIEIFIKYSFKDVDQRFQKELASQLEAKRDAFCDQNVNESAQRCRALIKDIFGPLEEEVKKGTFSKPGGYGHFLKENKELKQKYYQQPRKGIQAEVTLQEYLKSKEDVNDAILQADQSLSTKEKDIEVERLKSQAAQAAAKHLEEMQKKNEEMMKQQEKSHQEHIRQMTEKMEAERKQLIAEQEKALTLKLQEQKRLLKEGFESETQQLQHQIKNLENKLNHTKTRGCIIC
ncbi:guanylate-binding protein 1-like isoform X3 [Sminthopsis crassicaudata]|uniref:guanylate-binding protein 1-like isoform X3 n=1 Tax=Sminthopsis crassicaudata TaxID=9301 RepID=UPI003D69E9C0